MGHEESAEGAATDEHEVSSRRSRWPGGSVCCCIAKLLTSIYFYFAAHAEINNHVAKHVLAEEFRQKTTISGCCSAYFMSNVWKKKKQPKVDIFSWEPDTCDMNSVLNSWLRLEQPLAWALQHLHECFYITLKGWTYTHKNKPVLSC